MRSYVLEARSLEHRCQCCGDFAAAVFCEDCDPHVPLEATSARQRSGAPVTKSEPAR